MARLMVAVMLQFSGLWDGIASLMLLVSRHSVAGLLMVVIGITMFLAGRFLLRAARQPKLSRPATPRVVTTAPALAVVQS